MPTGADVAGTYSILSLILSLFAPSLCCSLSPSPCLFFYLSLPFFASTRWRDAPLQTFLTQDHNALSHVIQPAISFLSLSVSLCLSVSISAHSLSLSQCPFPPDKGRQRPFISPSLLVLCVFVLYQTRLPLSLYSLLLFAKKVSRGPGAPALRQGACLSPVRELVGGWGWGESRWCLREREEEERAKATEYIISLSALELGGDWGVKPCSSVCDKGTTSRNLGTLSTHCTAFI